MQVGIEKQKMKECLSEYIPRKIMQETIINPRYRSIDKIGAGSFGEIHKVYDTIDKKLRVVKIEKKDKRGSSGMLAREAFIMRQMSNCNHFARLIEDPSTESTTRNNNNNSTGGVINNSQQSHINDQMSFIIMSFLGSNLEILKKKYNTLSHYTTLLIGSQMIEALMLMHTKRFLHRDIKPENFVIGTDGNHHNIYIIDFGLSKQYIDASKKHIIEDTNKGLVGTARYTSINSHRGIEQSRRDDLEALGYVLIYLAKGELPWQNLAQERREEKFEQIKKLKVETKLEVLTRGLPASFRTFMEHVKSLQFTEEPKYRFLQESFLKDAIIIQKEQQIPLESSHCLDWCVRGACSIEKMYADKLAYQKNVAAQQKERNAQLSAGERSDETIIHQDSQESNQQERRETQFTETRNFYEDTIEKDIQGLGTFEVPLFRTDQSLAISKNNLIGTVEQQQLKQPSFNLGGQINQLNSQKKQQDNGNAKENPGFDGILDDPDALLSQELECHSENSSQYNNVSNGYTPLQDESVIVQKVVQSTPVQFTVKDNNKNRSNLAKN